MKNFTIFISWLLTTLVLALFMFNIFLYTLRLMRQLFMGVPNLPPSPPKLPIIGNLHQLLIGNKPRHQALWQLSKKYGPIMQIHIGSKPSIIISSPSAAKQILKTHDHIFCSRPSSRAIQRLTYNYADVAFSPESNHQKEMRKLLVSEFFSPKKTRFYRQILTKETEKMVRFLSLQPPNTSVDLSHLLLATISRVICKVGFGISYKEEPLKGISWEVMLEEAILLLNGSVGDNFQWFGRFIDYLTGWNDKLEKSFSNVDDFIEMIIDEHVNNSATEISDHDNDFLHTILELSSIKNVSDYRLTKEDVKAHLMIILTGGIDTTVRTLEWAMTEIARSKRVLHKLQMEIRNSVGPNPKITEQDITKMTYLKMVVKETFRLHPPAVLLIPHKSISKCQIDGYDVFPETTVLINAWGMGRDTDIWGDNASEFYPERFENVDVDYNRCGNYQLIPFGGGRRVCPALNTAPENIEFVIANLLYYFDWNVPNGMKNEDLDMEERGTLTVRKKLPLCLVPTKHIWAN